MNSALGGQADAEKHQASAAKWKWTQIIFLSARILKSILSLLGTFLFFFFFFLFLLSAEGDDEFPSLGSCGNKILIPSLVCRRLVHTHPGENSVCIPGTPDPVFSLCSEGMEGTFPASLLPETNDSVSRDAVRKQECRRMAAPRLHLNCGLRQLALFRVLVPILATRTETWT